MKIQRSFGEKVFDVFNIVIMLIICAMVLIPVLHVIAGSFSESNALMRGEVNIWPVGFNLDNYTLVFNNKTFWTSFGVSVFLVIVGTTINMALTIITAYPLSKMYLRGRQLFMLVIIFTMIFQAPMIPNYILVKELGMLDSIWSLIIPSALNAFNLILCITFFRSLPEEMFEAARVDGLSEFGIVWKIALPLSMPINVTLLLFYAVGHWNSYFTALLYITDQKLRPLQLYMFRLLSNSNASDSMRYVDQTMVWDTSPQGLQMATIVVATIPIVLIYPFVQKHFIKGAMLGSLKG